MTNKERAIAWMHERALCGIDEEGHEVLVAELADELDAGERRTWIAALEWALNTAGVKWRNEAVLLLRRIDDLKAEEAKR